MGRHTLEAAFFSLNAFLGRAVGVGWEKNVFVLCLEKIKSPRTTKSGRPARLRATNVARRDAFLE